MRRLLDGDAKVRRLLGGRAYLRANTAIACLIN